MSNEPQKDEIIAEGHFATEQEMYDILGEVLHDTKKQIMTVKIQHDVIHKKLVRMELEGRKPNDQQLMSMGMLQAQLAALPDLLQAIKEEQFKVYEAMKKKK